MNQNEKIEQLKKSIKSAQYALDKVYEFVEHMEQEERKEVLKSLPGVEGVFDGISLIGDDGKKYDVPANYAAKSRIVFGDRLKMIEENGTTLFKQIQKVNRKKIEGVMSKKEGKWYLLTDKGSYKVSDIAAEFNKVQLNDKAIGVIPEDNDKAPYAALDRVILPEVKHDGGNVVHTPTGSPATSPHLSGGGEPKHTKRLEHVKAAPSQTQKAVIAQHELKHEPKVEQKEQKEHALPAKPKPTRPAKPKSASLPKEFVIDIVGNKKDTSNSPATLSSPQTQGTISLDDDDLR